MHWIVPSMSIWVTVKAGSVRRKFLAQVTRKEVARQLPISRLRLAARLKMLEDSDAAMLQRIESIMEWERIEIERQELFRIRQRGDLAANLPPGHIAAVVVIELAALGTLAVLPVGVREIARRGPTAEEQGQSYGQRTDTK